MKEFMVVLPEALNDVKWFIFICSNMLVKMKRIMIISHTLSFLTSLYKLISRTGCFQQHLVIVRLIVCESGMKSMRIKFMVKKRDYFASKSDLYRTITPFPFSWVNNQTLSRLQLYQHFQVADSHNLDVPDQMTQIWTIIYHLRWERITKHFRQKDFTFETSIISSWCARETRGAKYIA